MIPIGASPFWGVLYNFPSVASSGERAAGGIYFLSKSSLLAWVIVYFYCYAFLFLVVSSPFYNLASSS